MTALMRLVPCSIKALAGSPAAWIVPLLLGLSLIWLPVDLSRIGIDVVP